MNAERQELPDSDLQLLIEAAGDTGVTVAELRGDRARCAQLAGRRSVFARLFRSAERDPLLVASPFLMFLVLVARTLADLEGESSLSESVAGQEVVPVFDAAALRRFGAPTEHRLYLAQLLASFTRAESSTVAVRTHEGYRYRRFSQLDPLGVAELLEVLGEGERSAVYRRLGDLALFLSGVFPEHVCKHPLEPRHLARIHRLLEASAGLPVPGPGELVLVAGPPGGIWLLEWLGRQAYRLAACTSSPSHPPNLERLGEGFRHARRILEVLSRGYLRDRRPRWFPMTI